MLKSNQLQSIVGICILALSLICVSISDIKSSCKTLLHLSPLERTLECFDFSLVAIASTTGLSNGASETTIDDIKFGELLMGDKIPNEDLQDHVVVMLCWRFMNNPREGMLKMVEWHKKYSSKGLILTGLYPGSKPKKEVVAFCKSMNVTFPIYQVWDSPTPRLMIFNHKGKMIFDGSPPMGYEKLDAAMKSAPDPIIGEGTYKRLDELAQKAKERKDLGQILSTLKTKYLNSEDADEKSEAVKLIERISRFGNKLVEKADKNKETKPLITYKLYQEVTLLFKGDEIGNKAEKILKELEEDKNFHDNIKADKELAGIISQIEELNGCKKHPSYNKYCADCQEENPSLKELIKKAQGLVERYPSSPSAEKVQELLPLD
ncbi:MAG: hypothetical protein V1709_04020 [Planctomycetota bacterium]